MTTSHRARLIILTYIPFLLLSIYSFAIEYAGITTAGTTSYPYGGLQRIGSVVFSDITGHALYTAVIDETNGYAYFGEAFGTTSNSLGKVVKVALGTLDAPPTEVASLILAVGESHPDSSVIDSANGYAYFGTATNPEKVVKVSLGAGTTAPTEIATLTLNSGENTLLGAAIDTAAGYAYFASSGGLVKVALGSGTTTPTRIGSASLSSGNNGRRVMIDVANGNVFVSSGQQNAPAKVDKFSTGGIGSPVFLGSLSLPENYITAAVLDTVRGYDYFATYYATTVLCSEDYDTTPGKIMKVALGTGTTVPTYIGEIAIPEMHFTNIVTDPVSGYMMLGNDITYPASNIIKVAMGVGDTLPIETGSIQLYVGPSTINAGTCPGPANAGTPLTGEIYIQSSVIDLTKGYTYWGTDTLPGQVVKVRFSQKGLIKGTKIILSGNSSVSTINFYSQTASGNIDLAIYDNSSPYNLVWQSGSMSNTMPNNWISAPISSGVPSTLSLSSGTYWLAWQTDSNADVPSYSLGTSGEGFYNAQNYGSFPFTMTPTTSTSETWSEYITYSPSAEINNWIVYH